MRFAHVNMDINLDVNFFEHEMNERNERLINDVNFFSFCMKCPFYLLAKGWGNVLWK